MNVREIKPRKNTQEVDFESQIIRDKLMNASVKELIFYLKQTHELYRNHFIPQLEQLFSHLVEDNLEQPSLSVLFNLFQKFSVSLNVHMNLEEEQVFDKCEAYFEDAHHNVFNAFDGHQSEEPYLTEIIRFLNRVEVKNKLVKRQLLNLMHTFNANLQEHAWIEEEVLSQKIQAKITTKILKSVNI